jgi:hypothetical protein
MAVVALGLLFALLGGLGAAVLPAAVAADPPVAPITDYANYPDGITPSIVPTGCNGGNVVQDVEYTVDSVSHPQLGDFALQAGDTIVMTWQSFGQGCSEAGISLSVKHAFDNVFDKNDNQALLQPYAYCGPGGPACTEPYSLTVTIPPVTTTCNFQVDAVLGPPLQVVGPAGSYYGDSVRGFGTNMLISAKNGGLGHCTFPPTTTPTVSCAAGGLVAAIRNHNNMDAITFSITKETNGVIEPVVTDQTVAPDATSPDVIVPMDEGVPTHVVISALNADVTSIIYDDTVTLDCAKPAATVLAACSDGATASGALITLTNPGADSDAVFHVNGAVYTVHPGDTLTFVLPAAEGSSLPVTITADGEAAPLLSGSVLVDCVNPSATISPSCAAGVGVTIVLGNTGVSPAELTISKNGSAVETVTVAPAGTITKTYAMAEDETSAFRVTGAAYDSGSTSINHHCVTVEAAETTRVAELPRTGSSITPMLLGAGVLILFGGLFLGVGNRLVPAPASSRRKRNRS